MRKIFTLLVMLAATLGMQAQDTWTVAGEKSILGVSWDPTCTDNDMTLHNDPVYKLTKTGMMITANESGYGYKVVKNHSWDENYPDENALLSIPEDGEYTITFYFNAEGKTVIAQAQKTGEYVAPEVGDQTWTVAGAEAIFGSSWDTGNTENDMTSTDGTNYTLTKEGVVLEAGVSYGFKIVADHSWDEAYPAENYNLTVQENGTYTVTITFNKDTKEVGARTQKTGEAVIGDKVWTIAGVEELMGSAWNNADTNNDMTNMGDGTFQLVKYNVAMEAEKNYEFKVLANHSWDENYGENGVAGGENVKVAVETTGNYDVTFVWNPESKELYATTEVSDPTEINTTKAAKAAVIVYNLQGQRVQAGFRGIVIKNGHKVLVK
jgi:hypothetical protein